MKTPPAGFPSAFVASALSELWGIQTRQIAYAPVGFGSHHWQVDDPDGRRWFATLHDYAGDAAAATKGADLGAAFRATRALADAGLPFVVAPLPAHDGSVVSEVARHRFVSVTPWLDAVRLTPAAEQSDAELTAVVDVLVELHQHTVVADGVAPTVDLALPERDRLDHALADALAWAEGPYALAARTSLRDHADSVGAALTAYDDWAARALESRDGWVLTHGEPHWRNVLVDGTGLHLVDWDTTRLAPPARDLWHASGGSPERVGAALARYESGAGRAVEPDDLAMQALRWDLEEVALYVAQFSRPHEGDEDSATAWGGLTEALASLRSWASPAA